ncbi:MAG: NAD(P)/FAD-dependent oxidoreductase [Candidatus Hodarchaeales archaeon]
MLKFNLIDTNGKISSDDSEINILIIGAGPAGLTAAIYASRANLKTKVIHSAQSQLEMDHEIANYPGFESITGSELLAKMRAQAEKSGASFSNQEALQLNFLADPKSVTLRDGAVISADSIIIAIGRGKRKKSIPGERELANRGISYCSTCDGPLYKGRHVIAIGNPGDREVFEDVMLLHEMGCEVTVLTKEGTSEEIKKLLDQGIQVIEEVAVNKITGTGSVESVIIEHGDGDKETIETNGVFIFGSVSPAALLAQAGITETKPGCVSINHSCQTNIQGVFAAGDLTCSGFQAVIAAGQGARAAMQAIKYIRRIRREKGKKRSLLSLNV